MATQSNFELRPRCSMLGGLQACCIVIVALAGVLSPSVAGAEDKGKLPAAATKTVDFAADIEPIFANHCSYCHGEDTQENNFRLDRPASLLRGGDSGEPAILPGKSAESHLVRLVAEVDSGHVMPPDGKSLSDEEIGLLRAWIDQGAKWLDHVIADGAEEATLSTDHWSFQPRKEVAPPAISDPWIANPVDAFILDRLTQAGLSPSQQADRVTLIRRLYLDMLGIPPTPDEIQAFVSDSSGDAWPRLVERVLASPHYGERWARHWLDVVRFAETDGFETNVERPNAYHYRDYVIAALNADKPYNQFVIEQLAGDFVGAHAATGFIVGGASDKVLSPDPVLTATQRQDELADMVNTTGTAFLGLTLGCARCHNHKFDPVLQKDYYAFQAVFAGVRHGDRNVKRPLSPERQQELAQRTEELAKLTESLRQRGIGLPVNAEQNIEIFEPVTAKYVRFNISATNDGTEPCIDDLQIFAAGSGENVALSEAGAKATASSTYPNAAIHKLEFVNDGQHGNSRSWISHEAGKGWIEIELARAAQIDRIEWGRDREKVYEDRLAVDYTIEVATAPDAWQTVVVSRGGLRTSARAGDNSVNNATSAQEAEQLLERYETLKTQVSALSQNTYPVYAGVFQEPPVTHRLFRGDPMSPREEVGPGALTVLDAGELGASDEQDRRQALAKWIASPENPLTARVMVNRIWHFHFGQGIVNTPSDFGKNGGAPSHPELLDWLANEFVQRGWSIKNVHRLILLSSTYQQSASPREDAVKVDADCRLLWRFPARRLEAEAIRDSMLATTGVLNPEAGGPGFSPFEPNNNYVRVYNPKEEFGPAEWRRMVYMTKVRMQTDPIFGAFDCPDAGQVAPQRSRSTTAIQSLNLFNSGFTQQQAELFAQRLSREAGDDPNQQIRRAFELAFGRQPDEVELEAARTLLTKHGPAPFCRALLNANEFLTLP